MLLPAQPAIAPSALNIFSAMSGRFGGNVIPFGRSEKKHARFIFNSAGNWIFFTTSPTNEPSQRHRHLEFQPGSEWMECVRRGMCRSSDHVKVRNKKSRIRREMGEPCSQCVRTRCFFSVDISVTTQRRRRPLSLLLRSSSSPTESHLRYLWQFKRERQMDKFGWFYCLPSVLCA